MTRITKSVTIRPHQQEFIEKQRDFDFSKFIQDKLEEYMNELEALNKFIKEKEDDKKKTK